VAVSKSPKLSSAVKLDVCSWPDIYRGWQVLLCQRCSRYGPQLTPRCFSRADNHVNTGQSRQRAELDDGMSKHAERSWEINTALANID
jgi:hypothetical protein